MLASEWFSGGQRASKRISLRPAGMDSCMYQLCVYWFVGFSSNPERSIKDPECKSALFSILSCVIVSIYVSVSDSQGAAEVVSTVAPTPTKGGSTNAINVNTKTGWNDDFPGSNKRRTEQVCSILCTNLTFT